MQNLNTVESLAGSTEARTVVSQTPCIHRLTGVSWYSPGLAVAVMSTATPLPCMCAGIYGVTFSVAPSTGAPTTPPFIWLTCTTHVLKPRAGGDGSELCSLKS